MNINKNLKASTALTFGDHFIYRGQRARFLHRTGYPRSTRYGLYQDVMVITGPDQAPRKWSLNMAGSVEAY